MLNEQTQAMISKYGKTYANIDPTQTQLIVLAFYDFDFYDYQISDLTTLVPMPEPQWSQRFESKWQVVDGKVVVYTPPPPTQSELISKATSILAATRYKHEVAGKTFTTPSSGISCVVASDRDSQSKLIAAYVLASTGKWSDNTGWKMKDGLFVALTTDDAVTMTLTVQGYVASCFAYEDVLAKRIAATTNADDLAAIDLNSGWPANG